MLYVFCVGFVSLQCPRLTVGESFFVVSEDEAMEHLEKASEATNQLLTKYIYEAEATRTEMDELKKLLYSKFGSSINLEDR
jgi:prefoldin subunit 4